jgi:hypothetical protein
LKQEAAMLAIGGIGPALRMRHGPAERYEPDALATGSRALIPVAVPAPGDRPAAPTRRPLATFLAHLIATQTQAPQTRARRRAEPADVTGTYLAATKARRETRSKWDCQA